MKESLKGIGIVFKQRKYLLIAIVSGILFFEINVLLSNFAFFRNVLLGEGILRSLKFFLIFSLKFYGVIKVHSFVSLLIISVLFGMLIGLMFFKKDGMKKGGILASVGVFLGVLAPGCAACGIGLASVLGIGASLFSFFPYEGFELSIFSIILLSYSVMKISKSVINCKINFQEMKGGLK